VSGSCLVFEGVDMDNLKIYEIDPQYVEYLEPFAPHLFHNSKAGQANSRKYIGIILHINDIEYFAPLSSFKDKHLRMKEGLDFIKVKRYAVINLNNMFPVPDGLYKYVDFSEERNPKYRSLLLAEYRYIKSIQDKIRKNAAALYNHKVKNGTDTPLAKRCNDFTLLEQKCSEYNKDI
jgi:protein AbiQ